MMLAKILLLGILGMVFLGGATVSVLSIADDIDLPSLHRSRCMDDDDNGQFGHCRDLDDTDHPCYEEGDGEYPEYCPRWDEDQ